MQNPAITYERITADRSLSRGCRGIQDVDYGVTYDQQQADFVGGTFRSSVVSQANA
jgi:hypothetical protein